MFPYKQVFKKIKNIIPCLTTSKYSIWRSKFNQKKFKTCKRKLWQKKLKKTQIYGKLIPFHIERDNI